MTATDGDFLFETGHPFSDCGFVPRDESELKWSHETKGVEAPDLRELMGKSEWVQLRLQLQFLFSSLPKIPKSRKTDGWKEEWLQPVGLKFI